MEKQGTSSTRTLTGKLIDANGRVGTLAVTMPEGHRAAWVLQLAERDGPPLELKGELDMKLEGERMQLNGTETVQDQRITWVLDMSREAAGSYAREALLGQYSVTGGGGVMPLTRGAVVLWDFA